MVSAPKKSNYLPNIFLAIFAVIFTLFAVEVWLRCRGGDDIVVRKSRCIVTDKLPGSWTQDDHRQLLEELKKDDPHASKTVFLLGDSVMSALTTDFPLPIRLDRIKLYNFGVFGYDLPQSLSYLKYLLTRKSPDIIVIGICLNDIMSYQGQMLYIIKQSQDIYNIYNALGPLKNSAIVALALHAYSRYMCTRYNGTPDSLLERDEQAEKKYRGPDVNDAALLSSRKIAEADPRFPRQFLNYFDAYADPKIFFTHFAYPLTELARLGMNGKIRIVVWPADFGTDPYLIEDIHRKIENEVRRHGFQTIDLLKTYKAHCRDDCFSEDRIHFSRYGNKVFFNELARNLRLSH